MVIAIPWSEHVAISSLRQPENRPKLGVGQAPELRNSGDCGGQDLAISLLDFSGSRGHRRILSYARYNSYMRI
jgi:hypothetical protein